MSDPHVILNYFLGVIDEITLELGGHNEETSARTFEAERHLRRMLDLPASPYDDGEQDQDAARA